MCESAAIPCSRFGMHSRLDMSCDSCDEAWSQSQFGISGQPVLKAAFLSRATWDNCHKSQWIPRCHSGYSVPCADSQIQIAVYGTGSMFEAQLMDLQELKPSETHETTREGRWFSGSQSLTLGALVVVGRWYHVFSCFFSNFSGWPPTLRWLHGAESSEAEGRFATSGNKSESTSEKRSGSPWRINVSLELSRFIRWQIGWCRMIFVCRSWWIPWSGTSQRNFVHCHGGSKQRSAASWQTHIFLKEVGI